MAKGGGGGTFIGLALVGVAGFVAYRAFMGEDNGFLSMFDIPPPGAASTAPGHTPPGSAPVTATTGPPNGGVSTGDTATPVPISQQPQTGPVSTVPPGQNTVIQEMIQQSKPDGGFLNAWQWNYYFNLVTGRQASDPFTLAPFQGLTVADASQMEGTRMSINEWVNLQLQAGTKIGLAGFMYGGNLNPGVFGTGFERMAKRFLA